MASRRLPRRVASRRKLHILQTLSKSKSVKPNPNLCVKKSSIIMDAFTYILKLKLQLEAITREYQCHSNNIQQKVKVDAVGSRFVVKVNCLKGEGLLVRILEAMEEMNLRVVQARVSCEFFFFAMDAILEADEELHFSADAVTQAILKAIQK